MKRVVSVLLLCALLSGLTGCALFDRTYSSVTPHQEQSASEEDASILRAETYADLVSCVQHFVSMGQSAGTVHVYKYSGDIESDLKAAVAEVLTEDPLGSYALKDIDFSYTRIVSYYECIFDFSYRRTVADMASIVNIYGTASIRELLQQAMANFESKVTIRSSRYYVDHSSLYTLVQEAYYSAPGTALGYPAVSVYVYPEIATTGDIRIAEITFTYPYWNRQKLVEQAEEVAAAAAVMAGSDTAADHTVAWLLCSRLMDQTSFDPEGSASVYAALCQDAANSEAIALGYQLLCRQAGIPCQLVQGTLDGVPHCWSIIALDDIRWHIDPTRSDPETDFLHDDDTMSAAGYNWSREDYPVCGSIAEGGI